MGKSFLTTALVLGAAYWAADFVLDRFVVKSDTADPTGFLLQAEGFGLDDVARVLGVGVVGAAALQVAKKGGR